MAGQLIQRGEHTWLVRIFIGRDPKTGKRRYHNKTIRGNKKDAQKYLNHILRDKDLGSYIEPSSLTLDRYLDQWLNTAARPRLQENTFAEYEGQLQRYVRPFLGNRKIHKINPLDIQALYADMQGKGLSPRTIRYTHAVLSSALKQAVRWRLIPENPATRVDLPKQRRQELTVMTQDQVRRFLEAVNNDIAGIIFIFALATGMRPSEYLASCWKDLDLEKGTVMVLRSRANKVSHAYEPKTARGRRLIPLPATLVKTLSAYRENAGIRT